MRSVCDVDGREKTLLTAKKTKKKGKMREMSINRELMSFPPFDDIGIFICTPPEKLQE